MGALAKGQLCHLASLPAGSFCSQRRRRSRNTWLLATCTRSSHSRTPARVRAAARETRGCGAAGLQGRSVAPRWLRLQERVSLGGPGEEAAGTPGCLWRAVAQAGGWGGEGEKRCLKGSCGRWRAGRVTRRGWSLPQLELNAEWWGRQVKSRGVHTEIAGMCAFHPGLPLKQMQLTVKLKSNLVFFTADRGHGCILGFGEELLKNKVSSFW